MEGILWLYLWRVLRHNHYLCILEIIIGPPTNAEVSVFKDAGFIKKNREVATENAWLSRHDVLMITFWTVLVWLAWIVMTVQRTCFAFKRKIKSLFYNQPCCSFHFPVRLPIHIYHYYDLITSAIVSQITVVAIFAQPLAQAQIKKQSSASLALLREYTGDRWIPLTNGLFRW